MIFSEIMNFDPLSVVADVQWGYSLKNLSVLTYGHFFKNFLQIASLIK